MSRSAKAKDMTAYKAYSAAVISLLIFLIRGIVTGDWTDAESASAAATAILLPLIVYLIPNVEKPSS